MRSFSNLILITILVIQHSYGQSVVNYRSPVDFDIVMAGNFGEIRANHFHSGIDIKALNGVGSPIFAVADGYVSRIGVAPNGYGNFMMVNHPNGTQSLYAHLHDFAKPYKEYIRAMQNSEKSYAIDKYISADKFPVKSGQRIASLGNSGSSAGPHLHFEIRDSRSGTALNPLTVAGYHVGDNIAPVVHRVFVYELDTVFFGVRHFTLSQTIEYKTNSVGERVASQSTIRVCKPFYLAYEVIDYKNGRSNTMGVASLTQTVDSLVNFSFDINKITFPTTRYINSFVQFDQNKKSKFHVLRAYKSQNNQLDIYGKFSGQGIISPPDSSMSRKLSTIISDEDGNSSLISLIVKYDSKRAITAPKWYQGPDVRPLFWDTPFLYEDSLMRVEIPAGALYDSEFVKINSEEGKFIVGSSDIALQKNIKISVLAPKSKVNIDNSKLLLVSLSDNGKRSSIGGVYNAGILTAQTRSMGTFAVAFDTVAPVIRAFQKQGAIANSQLKFKISDDLSGVKTYAVYIDGQWTLAEYDPKNALLIVPIVKSQRSISREVIVDVRDAKNNITKFKQKYTW